MKRSLILMPLLAAALAGCKPENKFQPPPPPEITVAVPLKQDVMPFEELTGNTVAFATVDLVARVKGFLTQSNYVDGDYKKQGDVLFESSRRCTKPTSEAEAQSHRQAELVQASRVHPAGRPAAPERVGSDLRQGPSAHGAANVEAEGNLIIEQISLHRSPHRSTASAKHLQSVGQLVGDHAHCSIPSSARSI